MMTEIKKWLNDLSIRYKLFITFLALIILPICIFLLINMYYTSHEAEKQALYSLRQVQSQTESLLEFKTESIKNVLDILVLNDTIVELSLKETEYYTENVGFWIDDNSKLTKVFYITQYNPDISNLIFYMRNGLASVVETSDYKRLSTVEELAWFKQLLGSGNKVQWITQAKAVNQEAEADAAGSGADNEYAGEYVSAVKGIINAQDIRNISGILRLDMPVSVLRQALDQSLFTESTSAHLVNSANEIICSSKNNFAVNHTALSQIIEVTGAIEADTGWVNDDISGEEYLMGTQKIDNTDWRLILAVPYKDIRMIGDKTRGQMLLILLIVAPLTLPLSFIVSASATKRIRRLIGNMNRVVDGDFNIGILQGNNDEIGQLIRNFNFMLTKISMLIDERFNMGLEIKNLELKALQAQINPHFLYNTLDLIDWISVKNNSPQASRLVKAMSKFYKLSLSNGNDIVTIKSELEHVKTYVQIQNMRFEDKIRLLIDIPDELCSCLIPKIILQPLVENSILHGILEREGESGTIQISGKASGEDIILSIHDDGAGITEEILSDIPAGIASNEAHGYGVRNIDERLKLYFGSAYGLTYKSEERIGTTVEIRIKAIRQA